MTTLGVHRPFGCRRSFTPLLASTSFIAALGLNVPASAQTAPAGAADASSPGAAQNAVGAQAASPDAAAAQASANTTSESGIEDIIVTAERRSQRLQDVPISITAVTGAGLARAGLTNVGELSQVAPGLVAPANLTAGTSFTPFIRGIGSAAALPGIEASVALYVDGVYQGAKFLNLIDLANVERIEVLKGPQGTLYGRNATGGAINVITKQPTDQFEGGASFSYGRFNETVEKGNISGPLAPGLNASLGVVARQGGDYGDNLTTGNHFGGLTSVTVNGRLAWNPAERLQIDLFGTYAKRRGRETTLGVTFAPGESPAAARRPGFNGLFSRSKNTSVADVDPRIFSRGYVGAVRARYSLDTFDLVSISSYSKGRNRTQLDSDGTSLPITTVRWVAPSRAFTQELQAVSTTSSPFQWIVGLYYIDSHESYEPFTIVVSPAPVSYTSLTRARAGSIFGQATYEVASGTKITGGLRYSIENRALNAVQFLPTVGNRVLAGPIDLDKTFKKLTWRLSVDQKLSQDVLAYASYNRGFKSGAYNTLDVRPNLQPVNPEVLDAYEVGVKSQLADRKIQLNAAVYYYDYKNIQVQFVRLGGAGSSVAVLENAAAAKLYGLDAELVVTPITNLRLNGGFNLEHSEYKEYPSASGFTAGGGFGIPGSFDLKGKRVLGAPDFTYNVGATYDLGLSNAGSLRFTANYSGGSFYKITAGDGNFLRAFGILNGSIAFTEASDRFTFELWGKNLTNLRRFGRYTTAASGALAIRAPLSYGGTVSVKF